MTALTLESPAFEDRHRLPRRYTGDADNVSPPLTWSGVPDEDPVRGQPP